MRYIEIEISYDKTGKVAAIEHIIWNLLKVQIGALYTISIV